MAIDRRKERRVTTTGLAASTEGVFQTEEIFVCDPTTGAIVGSIVGPMIPGNPDGTTPANTIPVFQAFTSALKSKLDDIEDGADANPPPATPEEIADLIEEEVRNFSPAQIGEAIQNSGSPSAITAVNGVFGPGAITVNAEQIPETALAKVLTADERLKMLGIQPGATDDQTASEITALLDALHGPSNWRVNSGTAFTIPINLSFIGGQVSWTNKPVSATPQEFQDSPSRHRIDARNAVSIQFFGGVINAADGTHRLLLRYNITANANGDGGTWVIISDAAFSIATVGDKKTLKVAFPTEARIDNLWIQLAGDAASGTIQSPKFTQVWAQVDIALTTATPLPSTHRSRWISLLHTSSTYTDAPVGSSEWRSSGLGETTRRPFDFSRVSQYRLKLNGSASANGAIVGLEYSTNDGGSWTALPGASIDAYSASSSDKESGPLTSPTGLGECIVRLVCNNTTAGLISPQIRAVGVFVDETGQTPFNVPAITVVTQPFSFGHASSLSTSVPIGTGDMMGIKIHIPADLRLITELVVLLATASVAPAAGTTVQIEWSPDNVTYYQLAASSKAIDGALGQKVGNWAAVPSEARIPGLVWLRISITATATSTPSFRMATVYGKQQITAVPPESGGGGGSPVQFSSIRLTSNGATITAPGVTIGGDCTALVLPPAASGLDMIYFYKEDDSSAVACTIMPTSPETISSAPGGVDINRRECAAFMRIKTIPNRWAVML